MATGPLYYPTSYTHAKSPQKQLSATLTGALCLFFASSIWGVNFAVSKAVLAEVAPMPLLVIRFALAFALFLGIAISKTSFKIPSSEMALLAIIGLVGFPLSTGALFVGATRVDASMASLLFTLSPVFIGLFAWMVLKEPMPAKQWGAMALALLGMVGIVGGSFSGKTDLIGVGLVILSAAAWALYTVLGKLAAKSCNALQIQIYTMGFGLLGTLPFGLAGINPGKLVTLSPMIWLGILYLGIIATALAFYLWNLGFTMVSAGTGSLFFFFQPLAGVLAAWALFGERLSALQWGGVAVMLAGVFWAIASEKKVPYSK